MVIFAVLFAIGLMTFWLYSGDYALALGGIAFLMAVASLAHGLYLRQSLRILPRYHWGLLGYAFGVFYAWAYITLFPPWQPEGHDAKSVHQIRCTVASLPTHYPHYSSFIADIDLFDGSKAHGKVLVYWSSGGKKLQVGQQWQLSVKLKPVIGLHNGVGIDRELSQFSHHVMMVATVQAKKPQVLLKDHHGYALQRLRANLSRQLSMVLGQDPGLGIIKALALGDKRGLDQDQYATFLRTGTSHLLAISGFHVGLAAALGWYLGLWLWRWGLFGRKVQSKIVQWGIAGVLALIYAALAGFAVSTLRAIVMLIGVGMYQLSYKPLMPWAAWGMALLVICLADPVSVLSPGFLLSFAAVACLIVLGQWRQAEDSKVKNHLQTSAWLILLMSPLLLVMFHQLSLVSYFANLFAIPWMMLGVIPPVLLGLLFLPVHVGLAAFLFHVASLLLSALLDALTWLALLPGALWTHALPVWWVGVVVGVGCLLAITPRYFPGKAFMPLYLLPMVLPWQLGANKGELRITAIDVGQGLSMLIQTHDRALLFDAGPTRVGGGITGSSVLAPVLAYAGVQQLDQVIISHGDDDHQGGLAALLPLVPAKHILAGEPKKLAKKGIKAQFCQDGQHWQWGDVSFKLLHPSKRTKGGNNRSCVLLLQYHGRSVLIPGDLEKKGEQRLVKKYRKDLHADVLVAGHHGSKTSSSQSFVDAVHPQWVIVSSGFMNRYGFPHAQVIERFNRLHATMLNTAERGQLVLLIDSQGNMRWRDQRRHEHAWWLR